ncbi:MAG: TolC family protein [Candidatus Coatesbacteria bacterium]|nr:TolC family protein [Candidatus Coatesbacteria bacterium]
MSRFFLSSGAPFLLLLAIAASLASCAHTPEWTPAAVEPPESLDAATEAAKSALREEVAATTSVTLPGIEVTIERHTVLRLTRDGAIVTALARNRSLIMERLSNKASALNISDARAAFDPRLLATVSYGRTRNEARQEGVSAADGGDQSVSVSKDLRIDASVSEYLPTGTELFLSGGYTKDRTDASAPTYSGSWSAGFNQSLLRGFGVDANLVSLRQARNSAARSEHEFRAFVLELIDGVETAYWELVLAVETLKIREFSVQLAADQLDLNRDLIAVGKLSADAIISSEAELASRKADLVDAKAAVRGKTIELIRLLNPAFPSQWELSFEVLDPPQVEPIALDADISSKLADLYRPELAQSRLDLANQNLEVVSTRNGLLPKLDAFASYGRISSGETRSDAGRHLDDTMYDYYKVGLSLDVSPINRSERASHRRAKFEQARAELAVENLGRAIEAEVRLAVVEAEKQWERIAATKLAVESRQEELRVETSRFKVGKSTNLDVAQVHKDLIAAQLDELTARIRYIEAITSLYLAEGTLLTRRGMGAALD